MPFSKQDNVIDWFQEIIGGKYPEKVQTLLKLLIDSERPIEILFEIPRWGRFKMLDFRTLDTIKNNPTYSTENDKERFSIPYLISKEIDEHQQRYQAEYIMAGNLLPFARDFDADGYRFLYFKSNDNIVYYSDLDSEKPEEVMVTDIEELLGPLVDIIKGISEDGKTSFQIEKVSEWRRNRPRLEAFVEKKNTFICDGECIYDVMDYKWIIEQLTEMTDGELSLESFEGTWEEEAMFINVTINGISGKFSLEVNSDWVDSAIVYNLNEMLEPLKKEKLFIEVYDDRWGQEFGVVFGNKATFEVLLKNDFIPD